MLLWQGVIQFTDNRKRLALFTLLTFLSLC